MLIENPLQTVLEERKLSQGDIEKRTRLVGGYVSRVQDGHTVPVTTRTLGES